MRRSPIPTTETTAAALIWANRFVNIGIGNKKPIICSEAQANVMQMALDEAYAKGTTDAPR